MVDLREAGAEGSLFVSSGRPKDAKSVSLRGGAGAEGETADFNDMGMGGRAVEPWRMRVGAVEPERRELRWPLAPGAVEAVPFWEGF